MSEATQTDPGMESLSDSELLRIARAGEDNFGCLLWLAPFVLGVLLAVTLDAAVAALGFGAALGVCWLTTRMRARLPRKLRARLAERALERRFCFAPLDGYQPAALEALRAQPELQAVVLFEGTGLPHGGHRFIRIELGRESRIALRSMPFLRDIWDAADASERMVKLDLPLSAASAERVRALLDELSAEHQRPPARFVYDGFPCTALVLRRDAAALRIEANLAGLSPEHHAHPGARLLLLLLELEDEVGAAPRQTIGSSSAYGDIEISRR